MKATYYITAFLVTVIVNKWREGRDFVKLILEQTEMHGARAGMDFVTIYSRYGNDLQIEYT